MPRPCAVESHAPSYKIGQMGLADATALCRGESRSQLQNTSELVLRCHGLVPWDFERQLFPPSTAMFGFWYA